MSDQITLNKKYFFNNNLAVPIRQILDDLYEVVVFVGMNEFPDGSSFCMQCNIGGGDYKGAHTCNEANEIIEICAETVVDRVVMTLKASQLMEKQIEFNRNLMLEEKISQAQTRLNDLSAETQNQLSMLSDAKAKTKQLEDELAKAASLNKTMIRQYDEEISNLDQKIEHFKSINAKKPASNEVYELCVDGLIYRDLQAGGVDNWEWYGESVNEPEYYKAEALRYFVAADE